jgi:hypothetical protein
MLDPSLAEKAIPMAGDPVVNGLFAKVTTGFFTFNPFMKAQLAGSCFLQTLFLIDGCHHEKYQRRIFSKLMES